MSASATELRIDGQLTAQRDQAALATRLARARAALAVAGRPGATVELRQSAGEAPADAARFDTGWRIAAATLVTALASAAYTMDARAATPEQPKGKAAQQQSSRQAAVSPAVQEAVRKASERLSPMRVSVGGSTGETLNPIERVRLCKEAAEAAGLKAVGADWRDVYAVTEAETSWLARDGMGRNGRASRGIAQLEDATARSLGITDPHDPAQALLAVARLVKEAQVWARARGVGPDAKQAAISVYYNLSTAARNAWDGKSVEDLPVETQRHVANVQLGVRNATHWGAVHERWSSAMAQALHRSAQAAQHEPSVAHSSGMDSPWRLRTAAVQVPPPVETPSWRNGPAGGLVQRLGAGLREAMERLLGDQESGETRSETRRHRARQTV